MDTATLSKAMGGNLPLSRYQALLPEMNRRYAVSYDDPSFVGTVIKPHADMRGASVRTRKPKRTAPSLQEHPTQKQQRNTPGGAPQEGARNGNCH